MSFLETIFSKLDLFTPVTRDWKPISVTQLFRVRERNRAPIISRRFNFRLSPFEARIKEKDARYPEINLPLASFSDGAEEMNSPHYR